MKIKTENKKIKSRTLSNYTVIALAVLNLLALAFTVVRGGIDYLVESEFYYANGFSLAFSGYPLIVEKVGVWLRIYSAAHLVFALVLLLMLGVFFLSKRTLDFGGLGLFSVITSFVLSALYMTHGIIAFLTASDYATGYYECSTAAFIPFILSLILTAAYFILKYRAPEEIELF